jgi:hypothetical protein
MHAADGQIFFLSLSYHWPSPWILETRKTALQPRKRQRGTCQGSGQAEGRAKTTRICEATVQLRWILGKVRHKRENDKISKNTHHICLSTQVCSPLNLKLFCPAQCHSSSQAPEFNQKKKPPHFLILRPLAPTDLATPDGVLCCSVLGSCTFLLANRESNPS